MGTRKILAFMGLIVVFASSFMMPHLGFSQTKNDETFADMATKLTEMVARFSDRLKSKEIGQITKVAGGFEEITVGQYFEYGTQTAKGMSFNVMEDKLLAGPTEASKTILVSNEDHKKLRNFLIGEFSKFYEEITPILTDTCKMLKDSPVRLDGISLEMAPFGMGMSITIGINYENPVFPKEK